MIRIGFLLVALWALVAAPVLCTAGVLGHECLCADEEICDHEADCDVDPCADQIFRRADSGDEFGGPAAPEDFSGSPARTWSVPPPVSLGPAPGPPPDPGAPPGVPHASDLPLRI